MSGSGLAVVVCAGCGVWIEELGLEVAKRGRTEGREWVRVAREENSVGLCRGAGGADDQNRKERLRMAYGAFSDTTSRYQDLEVLVDYRDYDGEWSEWTAWFEENWLKPRLKALGYTHVRFFGGKTCEYDGSFRERVCELGKPRGARAEFFVYG